VRLSTRHYIRLINLASSSLGSGSQGRVVGMAICHVIMGGVAIGYWWEVSRCSVIDETPMHLVNPVSPLLAGGSEGRVVRMAIQNVMGVGS